MDKTYRFQSTRPRGARPFCVLAVLAASSFNPRARVGRDSGTMSGGKNSQVSIHAPAWGATVFTFSNQELDIGFNPRARVGRDDQVLILRERFAVSIHAPAWGATRYYARGCRRITRRFNPRARVGRDLATRGMRPYVVQFQSTRPRGARLSVSR